MNIQNCYNISKTVVWGIYVMLLFLEVSLSGAAISKKRNLDKLSNPDMYCAAVDLAQHQAEDIFAHEETKKNVTDTDQRISKRATLSKEFLVSRGILAGTNFHRQIALQANTFIKAQSAAQGIASTPELETFSISFINEMFGSLSQRLSTLAHAGNNDERASALTIAFPNYKSLIDEKDFSGLLKCLHLESHLFTTQFKNIAKDFSDLCDKATPLSTNDIDTLIKSIRTFVSYGATFEEIESMCSLLQTRIECIENLCHAIEHSILYKPFPGQTVTQAFIGYALLPLQFDIRFESISELLSRARLLYLTILSATRNNHFAISCIGVLWNEDEDEEYPLNQKISQLRSYAESHKADEQNQPLYYYARELFEKLEMDKTETLLKAAFDAGDMRGAFVYMVNLNKRDRSNAILAKLTTMSQGAYACLLTAEIHDDMAERKKNYEVAGPAGYAYAYYQLGLLSLRENNSAEALKYFCLAFEKGLYSAHKNIYDLCCQLGAEDTSFSAEYKKLCGSFCGEDVDDEMHQKLVAALLN